MDTIKYQVNGIFEIIFGCLSDIINSITSFFDYLLIERELVLIGLLFVMYFTMCIKTIPIAVELWDNRKEKETSRLQKIQFFKSFILMILSFVFVVLFYIGISNFYINSNLTTEIDDVVLVEDGISDSKVMDDGDFEFATGGFKFFSGLITETLPAEMQSTSTKHILEATTSKIPKLLWISLTTLSLMKAELTSDLNTTFTKKEAESLE